MNPGDLVSDMIKRDARMAEITRRRDNPVIPMREIIVKQIRSFEENLKPDEDVVLMLVSFGPSVVFHAENIVFANPGMVIFQGKDQNGMEIELIQHHSQVNLLLQAVKVEPQEEPRRPIGFIQTD